jgi:hypothetical protein
MFILRQQLVRDFSEYIHSFLTIRRPVISDYIQKELQAGALWPEPLVQLNPSFEPGKLIEELVEEGTLDTRCASIFRRDKSDSSPTGKPLRQWNRHA